MLFWGLGLPALSGCTTSKAVRAWHDGARAEARADYARAAKRYAWAYERDPSLVGAELGRLRLLARQPDQHKAVGEALTTLLKDKGERVEVQLFAVGWALARGDAAGARTRLKAVSEVAVEQADAPILKARAAVRARARRRAAQSARELAATDTPTAGSAAPRSAAASARTCGPTRLSWLRLQVKTLARVGAFEPARAAARRLLVGCRADAAGLAPDLARLYLGLGEARKARQLLARRSATRGGAADAAERPKIRALSAEVAFLLNEPARVGRLVKGRKDARGQALRAWVQWREGHARRAMARAARASKLAPKQTLPVEVQVAAALSAGEVGLAEALLRGARSLLGLDSWALAFNGGVAAARAGKLLVAKEAFARAAVKCPSCPAPRQNLKVLRRALGEPESE